MTKLGDSNQRLSIILNNMTEQTKEQIIKEHFSKMGKKGGKSTRRKYGKKHFQQIGRKGALKRWGNKDI